MKRLMRVLMLSIAVNALINAAPASAIIGGQPDGNGHPYVAAIGQPDGGGIVFSGVAISSTVVLTVAHGAVRLENATHSDQARVTFDPVVSESSTWYTGTIHIDPAFNPAKLAVGDYAVVVFDTPLPVSLASLPTENELEQLGQGTRAATTLNVVGYGVTRLLAGGQPDFSSGGTRKVDEEKFLSLAKETLRLRMPAGDQSCAGDSGGPTLLGNSNLVAGITVGALGGCISSGSIIYMRVDTPAARGFIGEYVALP